MFYSKAMPTNDTDYSCHIKVMDLFSQSYRIHIMLLVIYSLGAETHSHTFMFHTELILRNQACAGTRHVLAFDQHVPNLKTANQVLLG